MPTLHKKQSKRVSTRKRVKIERKVREHNRKTKKAAKNSNLKKKKKDPGVPNSFPFKDQVLKEAEERKRRTEEEREKQKERRKKDRQRNMNKKRNLDSLVKDVQNRTEDFNRKEAFVASQMDKAFTGGKAVETSLKAYYKEFKKVIDAADVILQVLDARDPLGSRCPQVEEAVLSAGTDKKLVLLLNKIDLVPKENVEKWLKYLRNEFPTLAFKASTQTQRENLSHMKVKLETASEDQLKTSRCLGADTLMKLLSNYCRNLDIKTAIRVGVVGFPNTGKSSIINSLKRSKACSVGSTPGVTKSMQTVQLDKHIKLLDSPGIVMATGNSDAAVILRNCVKVESIEDTVTPVSIILKRCRREQIMLHYGVPEFSDVNEFLALLAKRLGRLRKGGVPDVNKAGKQVLQDWNHGRITYYTETPEEHTLSSHLSADIVTQMGQAFDIDALLADEQKTLEDPSLDKAGSGGMMIESSGPVSGFVDENESVEDMGKEDEEDEKMEDEEENQVKEELKDVKVSMSAQTRSRTSSASAKRKDKKEKKIEKVLVSSGNQQLNKARKQDYKKMKKDRKRADALGGKLSDALSDAFAGLGGAASGGGDYDFDVDFK